MIRRFAALILFILALNLLPGPGAGAQSARFEGRLVDLRTPLRAGVVLVEDVRAESAVTQLTIREFGLTRAEVIEYEVAEDTQPTTPFDNLNDGVFVVPVTVVSPTQRLVIEILQTTAADLDLYLARDLNGDGTPQQNELVSNSASGATLEYIDRTRPLPGNYLVLVHSYAGSPRQSDLVLLAIGIVPPIPAGNLDVVGPATVPAGQLFELSLRWNLPAAQLGDQWYGAFDLGTNPANPGNLGYFPVDLTLIQVYPHYLPLMRK